MYVWHAWRGAWGGMHVHLCIHRADIGRPSGGKLGYACIQACTYGKHVHVHTWGGHLAANSAIRVYRHMASTCMYIHREAIWRQTRRRPRAAAVEQSGWPPLDDVVETPWPWPCPRPPVHAYIHREYIWRTSGVHGIHVLVCIGRRHVHGQLCMHVCKVRR